MTPLTLAQKAALLAGGGFWNTLAYPEADIGSIILADGPHGLRRPIRGGDELGLADSVPATCFPPSAGVASSFNPALLERLGRAVGEEARANSVGLILGPGVNIKRSPLCGRNFEYYSEDPLVSGELGAAWVRGLQSTGVGASAKHFAGNNQETNRMTVSAQIDERTLREIYLPAFETIVTREQPWAVTCSYNKVNGTFSSENHWLLSTVLREEWGFDGAVVSDWGAVDDRVKALAAGTDLEMPGPQEGSERDIVSAVRAGEISELDVDRSVARIKTLVSRSSAKATPYDETEHHELAYEAALESVVLLRNENDILPLSTDQSIAVIGAFAQNPRLQGSGSSQVIPTRVDSALESLSVRATVGFAPGYSFGLSDDADLRAEAVELAASHDVAVVFVGLPDADETEGQDREHIELPTSHVALIAAVAAANPNTVVVLTNGGVVSLEPWHDSVAAILEAWLLGQAGGSAIADILLGAVNPSGHLAETIPKRLSDTPSFLNFPGDRDSVRYGEGMFVGYRYYETVDVAPRYPFGHGLSYTTFEWSDFGITRDGRVATVTVTNTGDRAGADVVQLYVGGSRKAVRSPLRELRAFRKVWLEPGESTTVTLGLTWRSFAYWDVATSRWQVTAGQYDIEFGRSSHDIAGSVKVTMQGTGEPKPLDFDSPVSDWLDNPVSGPVIRRILAANSDANDGGASVIDRVSAMPMLRLMRLPGVTMSETQLTRLLKLANNNVVEKFAGMFSRN